MVDVDAVSIGPELPPTPVVVSMIGTLVPDVVRDIDVVFGSVCDWGVDAIFAFSANLTVDTVPNDEDSVTQ